MKTAFTNCTVLDGAKDMTPLPHATVLVEDERIVSVGTDVEIPSGTKIIDLDGRYIMPGLINMHVHLPGSGKPQKVDKKTSGSIQKKMNSPIAQKIIKSMCYDHAKTELMSGVTTIRVVGGLGNIDSTIRNEINSGKKLGPRMLVANLGISVPGGHAADMLAYSATSAEEAVQFVRKIALDKPDLIKLMVTGGVIDATVKGEPGVLRMPPEYVKAACDEAHKLGFSVAAHAESTQGVRVCLENGVDAIEHGAPLDDYIIGLFKEHKACLITTISPSVPTVFLDQESSRLTDVHKHNGKLVHEGIVSAAKTAIEHDIPVGLGTDPGARFITHYDMWREIVYFHKLVGVTTAFALYTATLKNAEILGLSDEIGSIQAGKLADLLITEKNPLEDLIALRQPYMVVMNGTLIKEPKVKKDLMIDKELDQVRV